MGSIAIPPSRCQSISALAEVLEGLAGGERVRVELTVRSPDRGNMLTYQADYELGE